jgi:hypothetical protein
MMRENGLSSTIVLLIISILQISKVSALEGRLPMMISLTGKKDKTAKVPIF